MDEPTHRTCRGCQELKPLDQFSKAPRGKWGRKARCKACDADRHAASHIPANPSDTDALRAANWHAKNTGPKTCTRCGEAKPRSEFGVSRQGKYGPVLRSHCKPCSSDKAKEWYHDHPKRANARKRVRELEQYGLTPQSYNDMLLAQGGVCAICGGTESNPKFNRLSVDHCHDTGQVRGLLCNRCNRALGLLDDDTKILRKAISYLLKERR